MNDSELQSIQGGGFSIGLGLLIGGLVTFAAGFIDGWVRPLRCR